MAEPTLYLVDASGYIFRAYYAIRSLTTSKGFPTNALYGFTSMLMKLVREEKPDHIAIIFDVARKSFRTEKFPAYKANRAEPPPDLIPQFPYFRKIVKALNMPCLELSNYEADDVIGTIAKKMGRRKLKTVIVTGDKDLMQLIDEKIAIYDSMREKRIGIPEVKERFGVEPDRVPDVLGLAGDSSDNIPGVPGVGEKTAVKLIQEHGSLETVLKKAGSIPGKLGEKLKQFGDQARLCKELATIVTDAPIEYNFNDFELKEPDTEALRELFRELEFNRLLMELAPQKVLSTQNYHLVITEEEWAGLLKKLAGSDGFAFDLETTSLDPLTAKIVGLSFSALAGEAFYVPVGHTGADLPRQLAVDKVLGGLKAILADPKIPKYAQNGKYDCAVLRQHGIWVRPFAFDTMVAAYLLNPEGNHNLEVLAQEYLQHKITTYKELVGTGKQQKRFDEIGLEAARDYSCEDADVTFRLVGLLGPRLKEQGLWELFETLEMPLVPVLMEMELEGVRVDPDILKKLSKEYARELAALEKKIWKVAGTEFNINSPKQLQEVLFGRLGLKPVRKTKTGFSTDVDVLEALAREHELPRHLAGYRQLAKLKSTYVDALVELVHPRTGRIHTSFNQTVVATGRLSSSDPNLQNIPVRTEEGRRIREAFVAVPGCELVSADYSQIELRILAHISGDSALLKAFEADQDIHRQTAARLFGKPLAKITPEERGIAKTVNFGVLYGQTAYGLSQQLGIDPKDAAVYIDNYYKEYAGVAAYKEKALVQARKTKRVETLFGRRRHFPDIDSPNPNVRSLAERMAFNTIFQGTAADIIKRAMIDIAGRLRTEGMKAKMILQVHDELVFEVPKKELALLKRLVVEEMEGAANLKVPLRVDVGHGPNWSLAH